MTKEIISQEELKRVLEYNPDTGIFTWKVKLARHIRVGQIAGSVSGDKTRKGGVTRRITIYGKRYQPARLAFLYMTGSIPEIAGHYDHKQLNCKWSNLRAIIQAEINKNQSKSINNTSGVTGVQWHKRGKWAARITYDRKVIQVYWGDDFFEACRARKSAENKYGFHPNHGGL